MMLVDDSATPAGRSSWCAARPRRRPPRRPDRARRRWPSGPRARCSSAGPTASSLFASTREPLELARDATGHPLRVEEVHDGTVLELQAGEVVHRSRFHVDRRFVGRRFVTYPNLPEKPELVRIALAAFL